MGNLEKEERKRIRHTQITRAIVGTIGLTGTLAVAAVAPNVLGALGKTKFFSQQRLKIKGAFSRMLQNGYITLEKRNGTAYAVLTEKGRILLQVESAKTSRKPKRWDGKWRLLIFDIAEKRRRIRNQIRITLQNIGFVRLQNSVWAYPYDCEDLIVLLKADLKMGKEVLYIIADQIENDSNLRLHFGLPTGN